MESTAPEAGPSSARSTVSSLLLPLPPYSPSPLTGSTDLLSQFGLNGLYDEYVRPYLPPAILATLPSAHAVPAKGKERETTPIVGPGGTRSIGFSFGGIKIGGEVEVVLEKAKRVKFDKSYVGMIADIPGRNAIKKDTHLVHLVMNPDPQPLPTIKPFDPETLRHAFSLRVGQIPAFDGSIFLDDGGGEPVAKKKKKKRKLEATDGLAVAGIGSPQVGDVDSNESRKKKRRNE